MQPITDEDLSMIPLLAKNKQFIKWIEQEAVLNEQTNMPKANHGDNQVNHFTLSQLLTKREKSLIRKQSGHIRNYIEQNITSAPDDTPASEADELFEKWSMEPILEKKASDIHQHEEDYQTGDRSSGKLIEKILSSDTNLLTPKTSEHPQAQAPMPSVQNKLHDYHKSQSELEENKE